MSLPARSIQADPTLTTDRTLNLFEIAQFGKGPRKNEFSEPRGEARCCLRPCIMNETEIGWVLSHIYSCCEFRGEHDAPKPER